MVSEQRCELLKSVFWVFWSCKDSEVVEGYWVGATVHMNDRHTLGHLL